MGIGSDYPVAALGLDWTVMYRCLGQMVIKRDTYAAKLLLALTDRRAEVEPLKGRYAVVTGLRRDDPYREAAEDAVGMVRVKPPQNGDGAFARCSVIGFWRS